MTPGTRKRTGRGAGIILPLGLILFLVVGCGPTQMAKDQLEIARKTYAQAKADPHVEALAPTYLADAEKAVRSAEQAGSSDDMMHLSYMAEKKTRLAMSVAEGKMAESETQKLNVEMADLIARKQELDRLRELEKRRALTEAERAMLSAKTEAERARLAAQMEAERAAKAKADADQLMKELADLKAQQTERGIVLTMGDVLFAFGKADLSPKADRNVQKLADFLKKYPNRNVLIEGHTDSVGSEEFNLNLSRKRAGAVRDKLAADGIDPGRITTVGYGKKYPAVPNDTEANRALNRRVEVIILNEGVKAETQMRE
jgi:OOP family OmpA-OmpF porin